MRLTKKIDNYYDIFIDWTKRYEPEELNKNKLAIHKLGQLEDIEEELGIDLITLFKALKDGIYHRYLINEIYDEEIYFEKPEHLSIGLNGLVCAYTDYYDDDLRYEYSYKDYGKEWAFTKEELE